MAKKETVVQKKRKSDKFKGEKVNHQTDRGTFFSNYDYTEEGQNETSPGGGLYHGYMGKYKSVSDFSKKNKAKKSLAMQRIAERTEEMLLLLCGEDE